MFRARVADLLPRPILEVELRLSVALEGLLLEMRRELREAAERSLRSKGY